MRRYKIWLVIFVVLVMMSEACATKLGEFLNPDKEAESYEVMKHTTALETTESGENPWYDMTTLNRPEDSLGQKTEELQSLYGAVEDAKKTQEINYVLGEYTEDGYISHYANYYFVTPEGCELATQEEVLVEAGYSEEDVANNYEEILKEYVQQAFVIDMYAVFPETGTNISYMAEGVTQSITSTRVAMDVLLSDESGEMLEEYGGLESVEIAGIEYLKGVVKFPLGYQGTVLCREFYERCDNHILNCIIVEYVEGNEAERDVLLGAMQEYITEQERVDTLESIPKEQEEKVKAESPSYVFGSFTDEGYVSGYLGYSVVTPDGWYMSDYRELKRVTGLEGQVTATNFAELMEEYAKENRVCDMRIGKKDTNTYAYMWVKDSRMDQYDNDWDYYLEVNASVKQTVAERYGETLTVIKQKETVEIAGIEFVGSVFQKEEDGEVWMEAEYWAEVKDKLLELSIQYEPGDEADCVEAIAAFSAL